MTLLRTCCCEGCFANDDCPVPYTGLGDFTYTADVDTGAIAGNFRTAAITDIRINPVLDPVAGYAFAYVRDKCCFTGLDCTGPTDVFSEKYFDHMGIPEVVNERTNYPCYTVITSPKALPAVVYQKRCTAPRRVEGKGCFDVGDNCADLFPDCYQGPAPNYLTDLQVYESPYALMPDSSPAGDWTADVEPAVDFGALTVGSGQLLIRRNSQSTFQVTLSSGSNVNTMSYRHRENICDGPATDCGPCTQPVGGSGGIPCSAGRCCCRSTLRFTFTVRRVVYPITYVWNSFTHEFDRTQGSPYNWTQSVVCIYEGPVDERLYLVTGTSALRTFTLLAAFIFDDTPGPSVALQAYSNDYCPWDTFGDPLATGVGTSVGPSDVLPTTVVDDECAPCVAASPPTPAVLSMEQAERLGIKRLITVTRTTP